MQRENITNKQRLKICELAYNGYKHKHLSSDYDTMEEFLSLAIDDVLGEIWEDKVIYNGIGCTTHYPLEYIQKIITAHNLEFYGKTQWWNIFFERENHEAYKKLIKYYRKLVMQEIIPKIKRNKNIINTDINIEQPTQPIKISLFRKILNFSNKK